MVRAEDEPQSDTAACVEDEDPVATAFRVSALSPLDLLSPRRSSVGMRRRRSSGGISLLQLSPRSYQASRRTSRKSRCSTPGFAEQRHAPAVRRLQLGPPVRPCDVASSFVQSWEYPLSFTEEQHRSIALFNLELSQADADLGKAKRSIIKLSEQKAALQAENAWLTTERGHYMEQTLSSSAIDIDPSAALTAEAEVIAQLRAQLDEKTSECDELAAMVAASNHHIREAGEAAEDCAESLRKEAQDLREELSRYMAELAKAKEELFAARRQKFQEVAELRAHLASSDAMCDEAKSAIKNMLEQRKRDRQAMQTLEERSGVCKAELQEEAERLSLALDVAEAQAAGARGALAAAEAETAELRCALEGAEARAARLSDGEAARLDFETRLAAAEGGRGAAEERLLNAESAAAASRDQVSATAEALAAAVRRCEEHASSAERCRVELQAEAAMAEEKATRAEVALAAAAQSAEEASLRVAAIEAQHSEADRQAQERLRAAQREIAELHSRLAGVEEISLSRAVVAEAQQADAASQAARRLQTSEEEISELRRLLTVSEEVSASAGRVHEAETASLRATLAARDAEYRDSRRVAEETASRLGATEEELEKRLAGIRAQVAERERSCAAIDVERQDTARRLADAERSVGDIEARLLESDSRLAALRVYNEELQRHAEEHEKARREREADVSQLTEALRAKDLQLSQALQTVEDRDKVLQSLSSDVEAMRAQLVSAAERVAEAQEARVVESVERARPCGGLLRRLPRRVLLVAVMAVARQCGPHIWQSVVSLTAGSSQLEQARPPAHGPFDGAAQPTVAPSVAARVPAAAVGVAGPAAAVGSTLEDLFGPPAPGDDLVGAALALGAGQAAVASRPGAPRGGWAAATAAHGPPKPRAVGGGPADDVEGDSVVVGGTPADAQPSEEVGGAVALILESSAVIDSPASPALAVAPTVEPAREGASVAGDSSGISEESIADEHLPQVVGARDVFDTLTKAPVPILAGVIGAVASALMWVG